MKTAICVVGLALLGCGGPPEGSAPEQEAAAQASGQIDSVVDSPHVDGAWVNRVTCSGVLAVGQWASNFGSPTPGLLGAIPSGCRPAAGKYTLQCSMGGGIVIPADCQKDAGGRYICAGYSDGMLSCTVNVDAVGNVTLSSPGPTYGMVVYAKFQ
jgi:hypothetical protein